MTRIDIVTAIRSEEEALPPFVERVRALPQRPDVEIGIVFVEDSSDDGTVALLRRLAAEDPSIRYWCLERGFGQGPAIVYGLTRTNADAVVMLDVDGSHPVEAIPEMIERFLAGAQVVQCRRRSIGGRRRWRNAGSALFDRLTRWLTGVDMASQNIYFRLVSRETARTLIENSLYWRFLRFPLPETGLAMLQVDTQERTLGASKYDFRRLALMAVDGMLSLMPRGRFALLAGLGACAAAGLFAVGWRLLGAVLLAGLAWITWRYAALQNLDTLDRMRCIESSDAPAEGA